MPLTRQQKEAIVEDTAQQLERSEGIIFTDPTGVSVESLRKLRNRLREAGVQYQVTKRTLTRIALRQRNVDGGNNIPKTSLGIVFVPEDFPAVAKMVHTYTKEEKAFQLLNGYSFTEERWIEAEEVLSLAQLPSREELLAKLVFMMQAPLKKFAMVVDQIAKQKAEGEGAESAPEKEEDPSSSSAEVSEGSREEAQEETQEDSADTADASGETEESVSDQAEKSEDSASEEDQEKEG